MGDTFKNSDVENKEGVQLMQHVLDNYNKKYHFFSEPFPHIIIEDCLDEYSYSLLADSFPDNDSFYPTDKEDNKAYWITGSDLLNVSNNVWADFIDKHVSQKSFDKFIEVINPFMNDLDLDYVNNFGKELQNCSFRLAEIGGAKNQSNKKTDIVISVSAGINTPCKTQSIIEPPHNDIPQKMFNSLLYMRTDEDDSSGGDLTLYKTLNQFVFTSISEDLNEVDEKYLKKIKTIKYSRNLFILFPNKVNAIHGVTARGPTLHTRRYINLNMESYVLKKSAFFKTHRSLFSRIKFRLRKSPAVLRLWQVLQKVLFIIRP